MNEKNSVLEQMPGWSLAFVVGAILPALISLNIFAMKADIQELRAETAQTYVTKTDVEKRLERIEHKIEKLVDNMEHQNK